MENDTDSLKFAWLKKKVFVQTLKAVFKKAKISAKIKLITPLIFQFLSTVKNAQSAVICNACVAP